MTKKKTKTGIFEGVRKFWHGQLISSDFFARHWLAIVIGFLFIMSYISTKYVCQTRMEEIKKLEKELEIAETESVRERSVYMGRTCESAMQELVDSMHLNLQIQEQPPYLVSER
ncbi:MAG: hypothetical protein HUK14_07630 [Muribaculaceae bacterium]|nr:hypothetical protein [Muribaculaceae bacterium]